MDQYLLQNYWGDKARERLKAFKSCKPFNTFERSIRDLRLRSIDAKVFRLLCHAALVLNRLLDHLILGSRH